MSHARRRLRRILPPLALLLPLGLAATRDESGTGASLTRLRAMPIELRRTLAANLDRFEGLERTERDALRALDGSVAARPPEERARDYELMRRYHEWSATLTEEQRARLSGAAPADRIELVRSFRSGEPAPASGFNEGSIWILSGAFNPVGMGEEAHQARLWKVLNHDQKANLETIPTEAQRMIRVAQLSAGRGTGVRYRDVSAEAANLRNQILVLIRDRKPAQAQNHLKSLRGLQARFFARHPPPPIQPHDLARFESELPSWIRERLSALPPDVARERLAALHYLVHDPAAVEAPPLPKAAGPAAEKAKADPPPRAADKPPKG